MALTNYGEQFSANVLAKFYAMSLTPSITNSDYEGEIKKQGDRVNVLMFLEGINLTDYAVGTNMVTQHPIDTENQLIADKAKYYNFDIDKVDKEFCYVTDEDSALIKGAAAALEKSIDTLILSQAYWVKAGNTVGVNQYMIGDGADTAASLATSATGGTITIDVGAVGANSAVGENLNKDGRAITSILYHQGFGADVVGKAIRLVSQSGYCTDWWRITGVTSSVVVTVENWDSSVTVLSTDRVAAGDVLKGKHGAGLQNADVNIANGWGYEIQAAIPTTMTATTIYDQIVDLASILNDNDIPQEDRHISLPSFAEGMLKKASQLQPDIAMYHEDVVINGKVGRVAGFDVHLATGTKCSTRAGRSTGTGTGADVALVAGGQAFQILANHSSFCTFADKWSESRVKEAELQFANLYQGLYLYGCIVLAMRRKAGAQLFATT